jgi:hypothetical protein
MEHSLSQEPIMERDTAHRSEHQEPAVAPRTPVQDEESEDRTAAGLASAALVQMQ